MLSVHTNSYSVLTLSPPSPLVHSRGKLLFVLLGRNQGRRLRLATVSFEFLAPAEDAGIHVGPKWRQSNFDDSYDPQLEVQQELFFT